MHFLLVGVLLAAFCAGGVADSRFLRRDDAREVQSVLDHGEAFEAAADVNTDTDTICGVPIPVYGPAALLVNADAPAAGNGAQGSVKVQNLQQHGRKVFSAFETRAGHGTNQVIVKTFGGVNPRASMLEAIAGSIICSAASPCPDGLPFTALIGVGPDTGGRRGAARRHTVVLEMARNGDLEQLLLKGDVLARPKDDWQAFVNGNTIIPDNVPELASARDLDAVLALLQQLAIGLQHMKERGVVHRDIKPANVMLDGAAVKFIDYGTVCVLDGITAARNLPARLAKYKDKCPATEIEASMAVREGRAHRALGCPIMDGSGSLPYISPLRAMGVSLNFGPPPPAAGGQPLPRSAALDQLAAAMTGSQELTAQFQTLNDNANANIYSASRASDLPYSLNWEQARTFDVFALGIMATELLTGQYGGIHSMFRFTCDGTIAGNQMCPSAENRNLCLETDGNTNIRLAKWLALDNLQAPPTTEEEKARARNRMWTLLKTVAEAARCNAPAAPAQAAAWSNFCKDKTAGVTLRSSAFADKRSVFAASPLKALYPALQYAAAPALYMPPAFKYTSQAGEAVDMDGRVSPTSKAAAAGWPSALLPFPATEATIKNVPLAALGDANVVQMPADSPVLAELVDLLLGMLAFHNNAVPEPADVVVELDDIRRKLYAQVAASPAAQNANAAASVAAKFDKHATCLRACQAMASEVASRGEQKKSRNAEEACNRHAGSLGRAASAYCGTMWTHFDTAQLDGANVRDLLKHSDSSLELTSAAIDAMCRRTACPLKDIDGVRTQEIVRAQAQEMAINKGADGTWATITALKGPVGGGGVFGATSFEKWNKRRTITVKELPAAAAVPGGKPRLEVRWKAANGGALDFDFSDKETAAGGCEQIKEAKWFGQESLRDGCAGRERSGGMCVCIPLASTSARGGVTKRTLRVYIPSLDAAEAFVAQVNAGVDAVRRQL